MISGMLYMDRSDRKKIETFETQVLRCMKKIKWLDRKLKLDQCESFSNYKEKYDHF